MEYSKHAITRRNQRAISGKITEFILEHGEIVIAPRKAYKAFIPSRKKQELIAEHKKAIQFLERTANIAIIISATDDKIITQYHRKN